MKRAFPETVRRIGLVVVFGLFGLCCLAPAGVFAAYCPDSVKNIIRVPSDAATIQAAINLIGSGGTGYTILVAPGTYRECNITVGNRGVKIISEQDRYTTIIDCDTDSNGTGNGRGFTLDTVLAGTSVEGFTIQNGVAPTGQGGGGIYINNSSPTISDCLITNCRTDASGFGGGILINGNSSSKVENCDIMENSSLHGGGVSLNAGSYVPEIINCKINANTASSHAGGVFFHYSNGKLKQSQVMDNTGVTGGGVCMWESGYTPEITDSSIGRNKSATGVGGGLHIFDQSPTITSTSISGNSALDGGNVYITRTDNTTSPTFNSVIMSGGGATRQDSYLNGANRLNSKGGSVYIVSADTVKFNACTISDNVANKGGGVYHGGGTVYFYNCFINLNSVFCNDGDNVPYQASTGAGCGTNQAWGGGYYGAAGTAYFRHCSISRNYAHNYGYRCVPTGLTGSCTQNEQLSGGGVKIAGATVYLENSILHLNRGAYSQSWNILSDPPLLFQERSNQYHRSSGSAYLYYSCLMNQAQDGSPTGTTSNVALSAPASYPMAWTDWPNTVFEITSSGYGMLPTSPCINCGRTSATSPMVIQYTDIEDDTRPSGNSDGGAVGYDAGCDEVTNHCTGNAVQTYLGQLSAGGTKGYRFSGSIGNQTDRDVYRFKLAADSTVVLFTMGGGGTAIRLFPGNCDSQPTVISGGGIASNAYIKVNLLASAGPFYAEVSADNPVAYTFVVGLIDDVGEACADSLVIPMGSTVNSNINYDGDVDVYTIFSSLESGLVRIETTGSLDTYGILLDQDCMQIDASDGGGAGSNFRIDYVFLDRQTTRYLVVTTPPGVSGTGAYSLVQTLIPDDHGNHCVDARPMAGFGTPMSGEINYVNDADYFQFYISPPGGAITATVSSSGAPVTKLFSSTDCTTPIATGDKTTPINEFLFPGFYYASVSGAAVCTYSFQVALLVEDHEFDCSEATVISDLNPIDKDNAKWSVSPVTISGNRFDYSCGFLAADVDTFKVKVPSYGILTLQGLPAGGLDHYGLLLNWACNPIGSYVNIESTATGVYTVGAGDYFLRVKSNTKTIGAYDLKVGFDANTSDDHGDDCNHLATPVKPNSMVSGIISPTNADGDRFRIEIPVFGTAEIYTTGTLTTTGELFVSCPSPILTQNGGGTGNNFKITRDLEPGVYYVRVTATTTGSYDFYCDFKPTNICGDKTTTFVRQSQIPVAPTPYQVSGTIPSGSTTVTVHYYGLRLNTAGYLKLYTSPGLDSYGTLRDNNCDIIASNNDQDVNTGKVNFYIEQYVESGGYYVTVRGESIRDAGAYTLNIEFVPESITKPGDDHGDNCDTATLIRSGTSAVQGGIDYQGDIDYFRYKHSGGALRVYTTGSNMDPYGYLLDENCIVLESHDDIDTSGTGPAGTGAVNYNFEIRKNQLDVGDYHFAVREYNRLRTGTYTLNLDVSYGADQVGDSCKDAYTFLSFPYSLSTVYEDAQDGQFTGWDVSLGTGTITNVYDATLQSLVINLAGSGTSTEYRLRKADSTDWNNTDQFILQWKMKYTENFQVLVSCDTALGHRYLRYTPVDTNGGGTAEYVDFGLGVEATDGNWRRFTRNLLADLQTYQPTNTINDVNNFRIRGSGRVDDIMLRKHHPSDTHEDRIDTFTDEDFYKINLTDNGRLTVWTSTGAGNTMDLFGSFRNSACNQITFDDDSGDGVNFRFSRLAFQGETYYVAVRTWDEQTTGSYTLHVQMGDPELAITSISPQKGTETGGTTVTINGSKFGQVRGVNGKVLFGTVEAQSYVSWSETMIVCKTPSYTGAPTYANVTVRTATLEEISENNGFFFAPQPTISSYTPLYSSTGGGAVITISGNKFGVDTGTVMFGSYVGQVNSWNNTTIVCVVPQVTSDTDVPLLVRTAYGMEATAAVLFDYRNGPLIISIYPIAAHKCRSETVTITGSGFGTQAADPCGLFIGGTRVTASTWNDTKIVFSTPLGWTVGYRDVEVRSNLYKVTNPDYSFKNIRPASFTFEPYPSAPISLNYSVLDTILNNVNYYEFQITSSGTIASYTTGTLDTVGTLYDSVCSVITQNDDNGTDVNYSLSSSGRPAGVYYLAVSALAYAGHQEFTNNTGMTTSSAGGTYVWNLVDLTPYNGSDAHRNVAEENTSNTPTQQGIDVTGYVEWSVTLASGYKYRIEVERPMAGEGECTQTPVQIRNSGGTVVDAKVLNLSGVEQEWLEVATDKWYSGTYTVRIWGNTCMTAVSGMRVLRKDPGGTGQYQLYINKS